MCSHNPIEIMFFEIQKNAIGSIFVFAYMILAYLTWIHTSKFHEIIMFVSWIAALWLVISPCLAHVSMVLTSPSIIVKLCKKSFLPNMWNITNLVWRPYFRFFQATKMIFSSWAWIFAVSRWRFIRINISWITLRQGKTFRTRITWILVIILIFQFLLLIFYTIQRVIWWWWWRWWNIWRNWATNLILISKCTNLRTSSFKVMTYALRPGHKSDIMY